MSHTPGPWSVVPVHGDICLWDVESNDGLITCDIGLAENATLIAAAPDMLAALEQVVRVFRPLSGLSVGRPAIAQAIAALAKAEGREP